MSNSKYAALRTISVIFKVFAVIVVVIMTLVAVYTFFSIVSYSFGASVVASFPQLIMGLLTGLYLFAMAEFILVFLDIEENTRASEENSRQTNDLLRSFLNRQP
jgi:hypothetical protein